MDDSRNGRRWAALAIAFLGITALYWDALRAPFLNDDFLFLESARRGTLAASLTDLGTLGNYYRPLARQIYFAALSPIAGGHPLVFHAVNYTLFVAALALVADLLAAFLPIPGVLAGTAYFALLPLQRVNLMWISCSQELLALAATLGAFALWRRGRTALALICFVAGVASKETALALPLGLVAWDRAVARRAWPAIARRAAPFAAVAAAWVAIAMAMRARHASAARLDFHPLSSAAALVHLVQSALGLDHPPGFIAGLLTNRPAALPLVLLAVAAFVYPPGPRLPTTGDAHDRASERAPGGPAPPPESSGAPLHRWTARFTRPLVAFGVSWAIAFALPAAPVSYSWSSYYFTLAAAGTALLLGAAFSNLGRRGWVVLSAGLLWWHAGSTSAPAFAVSPSPWTMTSHLTPFYFRRAAMLTDSLSHELDRAAPRPAHHSRLFFATLPPWAGFQMGNGALIRAHYRDATLESYFYSQFSETTAADFPCRFLFWDGRNLVPLYEKTRDPWFQVGSDLLLLGKPAGARHAFRRGLAAGGDRMDHLYWLGWSELMTGRRDRAEAAWTTFGATDDSLRWSAHFRAAHNAMTDRDTVDARRHLATAIQYGIGRPEAHAVLGELMLDDPHGYTQKYGIMELAVASWLNPRDWWARRNLVLGLARVQLDDEARAELTTLVRDFPDVARDTTLHRLIDRYDQRGGTGVVVMNGGP